MVKLVARTVTCSMKVEGMVGCSQGVEGSKKKLSDLPSKKCNAWQILL